MAAIMPLFMIEHPTKLKLIGSATPNAVTMIKRPQSSLLA